MATYVYIIVNFMSLLNLLPSYTVNIVAFLTQLDTLKFSEGGLLNANRGVCLKGC